MSILFSGKPGLFGLSNERELVKQCPDEFRRNWTTNKWCKFAGLIFFKGADHSKWKYKSTDSKEIDHQIACLSALLSGFGLKHEDKITIAGWMLSEMLIKLPK